MQTKSNAREFFLNLGATVALYGVVISLVNLLFTIIDTKYPPVVNNYVSSSTISWPVAALAVFFPTLILLMWVLGKQYEREPEMRQGGIHKWLTYLTLFLAGLTMVVDLITAVYFFIDGRELTAGFILKTIALLIVAFSVFTYYLSDIQGRLTVGVRNLWRIGATVIIIGSIVWGFAVLGSPRTQRLYKYDDQKVSDLMNISYQVENYYAENDALPEDLSKMSTNYYVQTTDSQTNKMYEYHKLSATTYNLCAEFNKNSPDYNSSKISYNYGMVWTHPAGHHCFEEKVSASKPIR